MGERMTIAEALRISREVYDENGDPITPYCLPDPVCDEIRRFAPRVWASTTALWTGVSASNPRWRIASISGPGTPSKGSS